jgi:hypothetical protein
MSLKRRFLKLLFDIVLAAEPFDASRGVDQFLFTRKERVAGGTDFDFDVPGGGTGFDNVSAGAGDFGQFVLGVDTFFHL